MIAVMAYATLVGVCLIIATLAVEATVARRMPTRWFWTVALATSVVAAVAAMIVPRDSVITPVAATDLQSPLAATPRQVLGASWLPLLDTGALIAWLLGSATLFSVMILGAARVARARRRAEPIRLRGAEVMMTDSVGPAVSGFSRPVVLVPRWILSLDESLQRLLLAHESEHARAGDVRLLWGATFAVALFPWNPAIWWLARRLRLAVEIDCDRRVLNRLPDVRGYADLLLIAARRRAPLAFYSAPHLRGANSDLRKRIDAMTTTPKPSTLAQRVLWGTLAAGALFLACESPRPDPVAPLDLGKDTLTSQNVLSETPNVLAETSKLLAESKMEIARLRLTLDTVNARLLGEVIVEGEVSSAVSEKLHETAPHGAENQVGFVWYDSRMIGQSRGNEPSPTEVVILTSKGEELYARRLAEARAGEATHSTREDVLESINPDDVMTVEVIKATRCTSGAARSEPCNMLRVRLKPGAKLPQR